MSRKKKKKVSPQKEAEKNEKAQKEKEEEKRLEKQKRRRENLFQRMEEVKPEQVGLIRFVDVRWEVIEEIDGKYVRTGRAHSHGLQIENRVYMVEGQFKMVNRKSLRITKEYDDIPEWATEDLIQKYALAMKNLRHLKGEKS